MDTLTTRKTNLHVDPDLWRALRVRAAQEGTTATALLNRAIAAYLEPKAPRPKRTAPKRRV